MAVIIKKSNARKYQVITYKISNKTNFLYIKQELSLFFIFLLMRGFCSVASRDHIYIETFESIIEYHVRKSDI